MKGRIAATKSNRKNRQLSRSSNCCKSSLQALFSTFIVTLIIILSIFAAVFFISWTFIDLKTESDYIEWIRQFRLRKISTPETLAQSYGLNHAAVLTRTEDIAISNVIAIKDTNTPTYGNILSPYNGNPSSTVYYGYKNDQIVPAKLIEARKILSNHPFKRLSGNRSVNSLTMEDAMFYLHDQKECENKPIFTSMAQVGTDLYWQLIENFIYTMVKFGLSDCTVMICVTDKRCMDMCDKARFPCYHYDHSIYNPGKPLPSALEQIANLKLLHLPQALSKGVDMLMLDLDVGFLDNPMKLVEGFFKSSDPLSKKVTFKRI
jgi:hypothetical protein